MRPSDFESLKVRLRACRTEGACRRVIDTYPELSGKRLSEVRAFIDIHTDLVKGLPTGTTRRKRLGRARQYGWGR